MTTDDDDDYDLNVLCEKMRRIITLLLTQQKSQVDLLKVIVVNSFHPTPAPQQTVLLMMSREEDLVDYDERR